MSLNNNIAVLVVSCDSYSDLWQPFFGLFFKYWPECPYNTYLSSNHKEFINAKVTTVKSEENSNWSSELKIVLSKIPEKHIIVILEDYFFYDSVDMHSLNKIIEIYFKLNVSFFRLGTFPSKYNSLRPGNEVNNYPGVLSLGKGSKYRIDLQVALWKKEYLFAILKDGESPWQFELEASQRSNESDDLILGLSPKKGEKKIHGPITYYCGAVTRGVLMKKAIHIANENNIQMDLGHRPIESNYSYYRRLIYISLPIFMRVIIDKILSIFSIKNS